MKNKTRLFVIICFLYCSFLYAQNIGDVIYKEVDSNGYQEFKWVQYQVFQEFDSNGKLKHQIENDSPEKWYDYDENGKLIHLYDSTGYEETIEYDNEGLKTHAVSSNGIEYWFETDIENNKQTYSSDEYNCNISGQIKTYINKKYGWTFSYNGNQMIYQKFDNIEIQYNKYGQKIYYKEIYKNSSLTFEEWYEYDDNHNLISYRNSDNLIIWYEYDKNGNLIHTKNSKNDESFYFYEYDENGNKIYCHHSDDFEEWFEYDENSNLIYYHDSEGYKKWIEYNKNGKTIKYSNGRIEKFDENDTKIYIKSTNYKGELIELGILKEDDKGNRTHYKTDSNEFWYEYLYYPNGTIKTCKTFAKYKK